MEITIVGDLMKNYDLNNLKFSFPIEYYDYTIGGTLVNAVLAAKGSFSKIYAIGNVNKKEFTPFINFLNSQNITPCLQINGDESTGICIINQDKKGDRDLMISLKLANAFLEFNNDIIFAIKNSSLVFMNGWSFVPISDTSKTCYEIAQKSKALGKKIIFDFLPHHIVFNDLSAVYIKTLRLINVLVIERQTFIENFIIDDDWLILKNGFNLNNIEILILFDWVTDVSVFKNGKGIIKKEKTNYTSMASSYYLDGIVLKIVKEFYGNKKE